MKKLLIFLGLLLLLISPFVVYGSWVFTGGTVAGCSYSAQDFSTYTESDEGSDLTVTSTKVDAVDSSNRDTNIVYKDFTAGYFSGDFTVRFEVYVSAIANFGILVCWGMSQAAESVKTTEASGDNSEDEDAIIFRSYHNGTTKEFNFNILTDGAFGTKTVILNNYSYDTLYFVTIARDNSAGANSTGQYTITIRTTSHTGSVVGTDTFDAPASEQNDFRYNFGIDSYDTGSDLYTTGYVQNMEIKECID